MELDILPSAFQVGNSHTRPAYTFGEFRLRNLVKTPCRSKSSSEEKIHSISQVFHSRVRVFHRFKYNAFTYVLVKLKRALCQVILVTGKRGLPYLTLLPKSGSLKLNKKDGRQRYSAADHVANNCSPATPQAKWTHRDDKSNCAVRKRLLNGEPKLGGL